MMVPLPLLVLLAAPALAAIVPDWAQEPSQHTHRLFRRAGSFPDVGSPTWSAAYPASTPDTSKTPQTWTNALNAAVQAGKIPNIPPSTGNNGIITYPSGYDPMSKDVCSAYAKCRIPGDTWDAPDGNIGIGFDDGPVAFDGDPSHNLYQFLKANNQKATHFMIGLAILQAPADFLEAFNMGGDIAVHTYTHPYMTTQTNEQLLAQFGWTMQIIYDSTGGYLPKFWRPPYGDMDLRVRAIAKEVFGLTPIIWNQDTADWSIASGGTTLQAVEQNLQTWITGPKSPGLIILEHELTNNTVGAFMNAYPAMKSNGWKLPSVARIAQSIVDNTTGNVYWNAPNGNTGAVTSSSFAAVAGAPTSSSTPSATSSPTVTPTPTGGASQSSPSPSASPAPQQNRVGAAITSSSLSIHALAFSVLISAISLL